MRRSPTLRVGLFAEGSTPTDPHRQSFQALWREIFERCACPVELFVHGFDKSQIVGLGVGLPPRGKRATAVISAREPLDLFIDRLHRQQRFDRVIIAFDALPPNEMIELSCMRAECAFLLDRMAERQYLPGPFLAHAAQLARRYASGEHIEPRAVLGSVEIVYMDPMFEALLVADEGAVLRALGHERRPHDWPKFRTRERDLARRVLVPAVAVAGAEAARKVGAGYFARKADWALRIVRGAPPGAKLWNQEIAVRMCRLVA